MRSWMIWSCTLVMILYPLTSTAAVRAPPGVVTAVCGTVLDKAEPYLRERLATAGTDAAQTPVELAPGRAWLIEVREQGNDAIVEVRDEADRLLARADHPERRTGTRRVVIPAKEGLQSLVVRVTGKEHAAVVGSAEIVVFDRAALAGYPQCVRAFEALAAADADYAVAQQISLGHMTNTPRTARETYLRAADEYLAAEAAFDASDAVLRGEAALALAGVRYFDLQDWRGSAEWAGVAEKAFEHCDTYRRARAEALAAAAWIEIATESAPPAPAAPALGGASDFDPKVLLTKARRMLDHLVAFHRQRGERYDEALQVNNIGLSYLYEGRFRECIATMRSAGRLFEQMGETPRQALAWQNRALCYWGIGHLPEALGAFNRALKGLRPEPYPQLYLPTLSNAALLNYALGHFDDSLRLHSRSLELAIRIQNRREEAQSLYGIGVTYYALGDQLLAREFLTRSLAIRTAAFDGRGRRATLRALATVYADLGEYTQAIELDREALALAVAPTSVALSSIATAEHTALNGNPAAALDMLGKLIARGPVADPLISAQARLERAVIERRGGQYDEALRDLAIATPVFEKVGSVPDGFSADLELARVLRLTGRQSGALMAVDRALDRSEAIRTQTANPEFRAQLQLPLRAAYELKLDLLWEKYDGAVKAGREREAARIAAVAFRCADGARARSFGDIAAQQYSAAMRRDLAGELARRETLYGNLAGLRFALDVRRDKSGSVDARAKELESEIASVQREVDTLNNSIAARTAKPGSLGGTRVPVPVPGGEVISVPADSAIVAYWLGAQSAYSWAITPAGIHWVRLTDSATIGAAAREFHDSLEGLADVPRERRVETGSALYGEIIQPIARWVAPYRRWFFVPDAALNYVPFAALHAETGADSQYVVMLHDVALTPAAWMLLAPPRRPKALPGDVGRMLLVSDPVYEISDSRLRHQHPQDAPERAIAGSAMAGLSGPTYQRIPGTAREASAIEAEFPATAVDAFAGFGATRTRLLQLDWSRYRYIHIASHGRVDARMPQLSALVLSAYDERGEPIEDALRAADLEALTLSAEVVVFSGCDTALGKEVLSEGMVGIGYATLARGAGAVVSSLWPVPDEMGADLVTEFYRHLVRDSMQPVPALSASSDLC
jgi:CHAT domain-containing protein/tetratricopeptide (TPR) repeat protein